LRIFIGWDSREPVAYHVLAHSILRRATMPISIQPLVLPAMRDIYSRARGSLESTEFSMTRFLVPYLSGFTGWSVFMDCDMLCRVDLTELLLEMSAQRDKAVLVCQHDYTPKETVKFLNQPQTAYPRKNWSSLMVFNNARCKALAPEYVNRASGLELHRFQWLTDDRIGRLPLEWNWLVDEYPHNQDAKILHYTLGGPWFPETANCDHGDQWRAERDHLLKVGSESQSESSHEYLERLMS
jgi:hypothetical protein